MTKVIAEPCRLSSDSPGEHSLLVLHVLHPNHNFPETHLSLSPVWNEQTSSWEHSCWTSKEWIQPSLDCWISQIRLSNSIDATERNPVSFILTRNLEHTIIVKECPQIPLFQSASKLRAKQTGILRKEYTVKYKFLTLVRMLAYLLSTVTITCGT